MARNRYEDYCYACGEYVPVGFGHFERVYNGTAKWRIKCVKCTSGRTVKPTDKEVIKAQNLRKESEKIKL